MRTLRFAAIGAGFRARDRLAGWREAGGAECTAVPAARSNVNLEQRGPAFRISFGAEPRERAEPGSSAGVSGHWLEFPVWPYALVRSDVEG